MKRTVIVLALGTLAAALASLTSWKPAPSVQAAAPAPPRVANATTPAAPTLAASIEREVVSIDPALFDAPQAKAYLQRQQFDARARRFFADPQALSPAARDAEAQALAADIDRYERDVQLSAGEAMNLRIGLVRATVDDEAEAAERIADIVELYRKDAAQREAKWLAQQQGDAAFMTYKAREPAIVAEVMAMREIPDGLTREEYLRQRLQAERVALSHR